MFRIQHVHFKLVFDDLSKTKLADFIQLRRVDGKRPLTPNFPVRVRSEAFPASAPTHPANTLSGAASSPHTSYRPPRGAPAHVCMLDMFRQHPSSSGKPIRSLFPISSLLPAGHCAHAQPHLCLHLQYAPDVAVPDLNAEAVASRQRNRRNRNSQHSYHLP